MAYAATHLDAGRIEEEWWWNLVAPVAVVHVTGRMVENIEDGMCCKERDIIMEMKKRIRRNAVGCVSSVKRGCWKD